MWYSYRPFHTKHQYPTQTKHLHWAITVDSMAQLYGNKRNSKYNVPFFCLWWCGWIYRWIHFHRNFPNTRNYYKSVCNTQAKFQPLITITSGPKFWFQERKENCTHQAFPYVFNMIHLWHLTGVYTSSLYKHNRAGLWGAPSPADVWNTQNPPEEWQTCRTVASCLTPTTASVTALYSLTLLLKPPFTRISIRSRSDGLLEKSDKVPPRGMQHRSNSSRSHSACSDVISCLKSHSLP